MIIKNRETSLGTIYERYDNNNNLIQKSATLGFIKKSTISKNIYFIIINVNGQLNYDANYYLNKVLEHSSYKSRERAYNALKIFYTYIQLFNIVDYQNSFSKENLAELNRFLMGGYQIGNTLNLELKNTRSKKTIQSYLGVLREFYTEMFRLDGSSIFKQQSIIGYYKTRNVYGKKANDYRASGSGALKQIPKYIKDFEYEKIMKLIDKKYSIREKVIIGLMYHYGLRIGEVLGLTLEDLEPINSQKFKLVIRNRVSDTPFQRAKGVITPKSREEYKSNDITTYGIGFQTVIIDIELLELIDQYIDETRDPRILNKSPKKKENLSTKAIADRIGSIRLIGENQYIFLNQQNYTPLTQGGWNHVLRKIFNETDIPIDRNVKATNLSHRFRHAFAMNNVKQGNDILKLKELMRHSNIESCIVYYNPDEEDKIELQKQNAENRKARYNFD